MADPQSGTAVGIEIRPLAREDFEAVVALDARSTGRPRRGYFEQRLAASIRRPRRHLQLAAQGPGGLVGFLLARRADGEYGGREAVVVFETLGVEPAARHAGLGHRLMGSLERLAAERGARALVTQIDWRSHDLLRFLDHAGFTAAPRQVLERAVHRMPLPPTDEEIEAPPPLVRQLREGDLAAVVRIDTRVSGQDRAGYLKDKCDEALHESAIRVSQVVEEDGHLVGFAMARVDLGDFGHVEATASLDTIGVDPRFGGKGYARALLGQLIDNLAALHVERLETEVSPGSFDLVRFLHRFGFRPSQRIALEKRLPAT